MRIRPDRAWRLRCAVLLILCQGWFTALCWSQGIENTVHNLSVSGPGTIKALREERICVFCHTPHRARTSAPLWNRRDSTALYFPYQSSTMVAMPGQPTGSSKLCLSCHDGTIALGEVISEPEIISFGITVLPRGSTYIGTDLSDDHPISFVYDEAVAELKGGLVNPHTLMGKVRLDQYHEMQCTTCHDPHTSQYEKFLVEDNHYSALCRECHEMVEFLGSTHDTSIATWNGIGVNPWPHTEYRDVQTNACENCHRPHTAGGRRWLLNYAEEEENCFVCHNGNVARLDIQQEFRKRSTHPVQRTTGVHRAGEDVPIIEPHVECVDCHNPHATVEAGATATELPGSLRYVSGVDSQGGFIPEARFEYEICFKCHGDTAVAPLFGIPRADEQYNTRLEFALSNPSYHPVEGPGRNPDVPSLIPPMTVDSMIACTSCHTNDSLDPTSPRGPHGSRYDFLLARQYETRDFTVESAMVYELCYQCHSRTSILADESFPYHRKHIIDERAPCSACHDPHGISSGSTSSGSNLINFNLLIVSPDRANGRLEFLDDGDRKGRCYLNCHRIDHNPIWY